MPDKVSIEEAEHNLRQLLSSLSEDERVTIIDEAGVPLGEVSAPKGPLQDSPSGDEPLLKRWESVAQRIGRAWDGQRSAVEQLRQDRRRLDRSPTDDQ